jgi:Ca2+-binding RTX toxin-like protein
LYGGTGNDYVAARPGGNILYSEARNDSLAGDSGSDIIIGGVGDDLAVGIRETTRSTEEGATP